MGFATPTILNKLDQLKNALVLLIGTQSPQFPDAFTSLFAPFIDPNKPYQHRNNWYRIKKRKVTPEELKPFQDVSSLYYSTLCRRLEELVLYNALSPEDKRSFPSETDLESFLDLVKAKLQPEVIEKLKAFEPETADIKKQYLKARYERLLSERRLNHAVLNIYLGRHPQPHQRTSQDSLNYDDFFTGFDSIKALDQPCLQANLGNGGTSIQHYADSEYQKIMGRLFSTANAWLTVEVDDNNDSDSIEASANQLDKEKFVRKQLAKGKFSVPEKETLKLLTLGQRLRLSFPKENMADLAKLEVIFITISHLDKDLHPLKEFQPTLIQAKQQYYYACAEAIFSHTITNNVFLIDIANYFEGLDAIDRFYLAEALLEYTDKNPKYIKYLDESIEPFLTIAQKDYLEYLRLRNNNKTVPTLDEVTKLVAHGCKREIEAVDRSLSKKAESTVASPPSAAIELQTITEIEPNNAPHCMWAALRLHEIHVMPTNSIADCDEALARLETFKSDLEHREIKHSDSTSLQAKAYECTGCSRFAPTTYQLATKAAEALHKKVSKIKSNINTLSETTDLMAPGTVSARSTYGTTTGGRGTQKGGAVEMTPVVSDEHRAVSSKTLGPIAA